MIGIDDGTICLCSASVPRLRTIGASPLGVRGCPRTSRTMQAYPPILEMLRMKWIIRASAVAGAIAALGLFAGEARAGFEDFNFTGQVAAANAATPTVFGSSAAVISGTNTTTITAASGGPLSARRRASSSAT